MGWHPFYLVRPKVNAWGEILQHMDTEKIAPVFELTNLTRI